MHRQYFNCKSDSVSWWKMIEIKKFKMIKEKIIVQIWIFKK